MDQVTIVEIGTDLRSEPPRWIEAAEQCTGGLLHLLDPAAPTLGSFRGHGQRPGLPLLGFRLPPP